METNQLGMQIKKNQAWQEALEHLATMLAPVDSMLREVPTRVRVSPVKGALAVPESNDVVFSETGLAKLAADTMQASKPFEAAAMRVAAANYRALAAMELQQASNVQPLADLNSWGASVRACFVAAEIGRLEAQYSALYPALGDLFLYDVSAQLEQSLGSHTSTRRTAGMVLPAFTYVALRPYLPVAYFNRLYDLALEAGIEDTVLDEIGLIGERFATLCWPQDATTGRRLADRLAELVDMPQELSPSVLQRGAANTDQDQRRQAAQGAQSIVDQQGEGEGDDSDGEGSDEDGDQDGDGQGQGGDQEGAEGDDGDGEGQGSGQGSEDAQEAQNGSGGTDSLQQLRQELAQQQANARKGKEGQRVQQIAKAAQHAAGIGVSTETFSYDQRPVGTAARSARQQMRRAFAQLVEQTAGGVAYNTRRGRIVPLDRKMGHRRYRTQIKPNRRNEVSAALAIVADVSYSMSNQLDSLGEAVWSIKGGLDDANISARGLTSSRTWLFSDSTTVLYNEAQRLPTDHMIVPRAGGGTQPVNALKEAGAWLAKQEVSHRFLVVLTDGDWARISESEQQIDQINKLPGGHTMLFGLDRAVERFGLHHCQSGFDITELVAMSHHARAVVAKTIKAGL